MEPNFVRMKVPELKKYLQSVSQISVAKSFGFVCKSSRACHYISEAVKGLFTWKEGAPANRATRLEGLKHSPPLHATHLTGTVSGLRELSLARPLSTTKITADQGNFFPSYFSFLHRHGPLFCLRLVYYIDLFQLTVILFGR